jgi:immune inhibitor A
VFALRVRSLYNSCFERHLMLNIQRLWTLSFILVLVLASCSTMPEPVTQADPTPASATAAAPTQAPGSTEAPPVPTIAPTETTSDPTPTTAATEASGDATAQATTPAAATSGPATTSDEVPPQATIPATASDELANIETLDSITLPRRDAVQLALEFGRTTSTERVARTEPLPDQVGDVVTFWMSNIADDTYYTTTARLELALDHVLMYVEEGIEFDPADLERSARDFNDRIYPRNRELFGEEWSPGVDGDPRITVLNARIAGAGGYFSGSDEVPRSVNRFSNEREMFYMNIDDRPLGSATYSSVLAHEFQHMIQWRQSIRPSTWINEGLSQLAEELNGYSDSSLGNLYLQDPDLQLTDWAEDPSVAGAHYGASYLFMSYFYDRYQEHIDLQQLVREGAGQHTQLLADDAAEALPAIRTFDQLFADWAVANLLDVDALENGRWSYSELPATVAPQQDDDGVLTGEVAQYGADYIEVEQDDQERVLRFDGSDQIGVVAAEADGAMWWSNRGDDAVSTLTRAFDLRQVQAATLQFRTWFDIEEGYDYVFAAVSTDGGTTWTTLEGDYTTTDDPQGANYGNGYTATSGGPTAEWVDESLDLTPYAGQEVLVRFSMVSDDAFNRPGMVIDDIRIEEIDFEDDAEAGASEWQAAGWVRTDNALLQRWQVRVVTGEGNEAQVTDVPVDAQGVAEIRIPSNTPAVVVVMATTPHTSERATYEMTQP